MCGEGSLGPNLFEININREGKTVSPEAWKQEALKVLLEPRVCDETSIDGKVHKVINYILLYLHERTKAR